MNNLDDLQKKLQEAQTLVEKLQAEVEIAKKAPKWEPKGGNYVFDCDGDIYEGQFLNSSNGHGILFATEDSARRAYKAYRAYHRLYKLAEELNEGWEPDWNDNLQRKYEVIYNHASGFYTSRIAFSSETVAGVYFKSEETVKKAIEIIKNGGLE